MAKRLEPKNSTFTRKFSRCESVKNTQVMYVLILNYGLQSIRSYWPENKNTSCANQRNQFRIIQVISNKNQSVIKNNRTVCSQMFLPDLDL